MAYTNGIFYLDFVNGSDATRTALTGCIASNPSGTITRINKTSHGLVTGAVVSLSNFSTWLNVFWKITVVDADNFDLDTAVWQTTADNNGTVTPLGGSSWSDAWKTIFNGPGARLGSTAAGDVIRCAKSPDPVSIGNATWTNKSTTVTLASAQTTNLYLDGSWTAANSGAATTTTTRKEGATASQITTAATTATSTKYAYYATGTLDLSSYDSITFWIQNRSGAVVANNFQIKLCSDTTGDTAVDTFDIPAIQSNQLWVPFTLTRVGGGALGSNIQSIGFYTGTVNPGNSRIVWIDNILACDADGLNLTSLISKNSSAYTNPATSDTWHGLQSINGTTVILGNANSLSAGSSNLRGYYTSGTSPDTVTTYIRKTIKTDMSSDTTAIINRISVGGTSGNLIKFSGGWNTSNTTQDGDTWLDGQNGSSYGFQAMTGGGAAVSYVEMERLNTVRYLIGVGGSSFSSGVSDGCVITGVAANCNQGLATGTTNSTYVFMMNNCAAGFNANASSPASSTNKVSIYSYNVGGFLLNNDQAPGYYYPYIIHANSGGAITINAEGTTIIDTVVIDAINTTSAAITLTSGEYIINDLNIKNSTINTLIRSTQKTSINKLTSSGNTLSSTTNTGLVTVKQAASSESLVNYTTTSRYTQPSAFFSNINSDVNNNRAYWSLGNSLSQTTTRHTASGVAWQINITNTAQTSSLPAQFPIAKIACNANSLVTVKAWVKLSHATDIGAKLCIKGNQIPGVNSDVTATKTADTNWEELTITFTPTVNGVVEICVLAYWLANAADESVYVDDVTVTQA